MSQRLRPPCSQRIRKEQSDLNKEGEGYRIEMVKKALSFLQSEVVLKAKAFDHIITESEEVWLVQVLAKEVDDDPAFVLKGKISERREKVMWKKQGKGTYSEFVAKALNESVG